MNIKWYKNEWYWGAIVVGIFIFILAGYSQTIYSFGLITTEGSYKMLSVEFLFRIIFNPLWAIALWFYEKGLKKNSLRHHNVLQNIQGLLVGAESKNISAKKIYNIIYKYEDTEKTLNNKFKMDDSVTNDTSSPVI